MLKTTKLLFLFPVFLTLAACGGGGGGGGNDSNAVAPTPTPPTETTLLLGSVAGASIIAMDASGRILTTDDTGGKTENIDSDNNGSLDAFSFRLTGIPVTEDISLYLVTEGRIFPVYFDTNVLDFNIFSLSSPSAGQIDLGFINIDYKSGRGIASLNPSENERITSKGVSSGIPAGINNPPTQGLTVRELNSKGQNAVASGWITGAKGYFEAAVNRSSGSAGNDADTARFMFALTRVAALGFDTLSDGNANDKERLGDLLDLFGFSGDYTRGSTGLIKIPETFPTASPSGNDISNFSRDVIGIELKAAADNLETVSSAFDAVLIFDDEEFNVDHGDALFFGGLFRSALATITILTSYDLNVDIDEIFNNDRTLEESRNINRSLLGAPDLNKLAAARGSLGIALVQLELALDSISAETDDQADDLITIDEQTDIGGVKDWIEETQSSLSGDSTVIGSVSINLQRFFNNGIALDDTTMPGIVGNNVDETDGFFDDPTLGGVILDTDIRAPGTQNINKDDDRDGIADVLQIDI
ncbi:MAG: hypothetical protein P8M21_05995 [Halioglobus sp.]|nr:hypothetical protein [Halioglobus sp.]